MFCDLVGSTSLAAKLDPEEQRLRIFSMAVRTGDIEFRPCDEA